MKVPSDVGLLFAFSLSSGLLYFVGSFVADWSPVSVELPISELPLVGTAVGKVLGHERMYCSEVLEEVLLGVCLRYLLM